MKHPDYPGVSSMQDRHGKIRWRYKMPAGKFAYLPGEPHTSAFDARYQALIEGRIAAPVVKLPTASHPQSLKAAWRKVCEAGKWKKLDASTQDAYTWHIEKYLSQPTGNLTIGDGPVADYRPRHVQAAMDAWSDTPMKAAILLTVLRKMMKAAILEEWIEYDPTYGIEKPERFSDGYQAWPPEMRARFEACWPIGSRPRTAYELALWLGNRRSDVALLRWDQLTTQIVIDDDGSRRSVEGFAFIQHKGRKRKRKAMFLPITPMLAEALAPLPRDTETVLTKEDGGAYKIHVLSVMMCTWCRKAGIPAGYSMHGLRKALGGMLADADATGHQSRDVLGHATMKEADRYAMSREQARTAVRGMDKVVKLVRG